MDVFDLGSIISHFAQAIHAPTCAVQLPSEPSWVEAADRANNDPGDGVGTCAGSVLAGAFGRRALHGWQVLNRRASHPASQLGDSENDF